MDTWSVLVVWTQTNDENRKTILSSKTSAIAFAIYYLKILLPINNFNTRSVGWNIFIHHKYQVSSYVSPFRDDLLILTKMICWERVQAGAARLHNLMRRFMRNGADILPSNIKLWVIALMRCPGKKCQYVKV